MRWKWLFLLIGIPGALLCRSIIDVKAGYFFFLEHTMNKVYDDGGLDLQLSGSYKIKKWLHLYASAEWTQKTGHSLSFDQKTNLWQIPISVGVKGVYRIASRVDGYIAVGPRYIYTHIHNFSTYVDKHLHANGIGGFGNLGFLIDLDHGYTLDLFGEYSYCRQHFHSSIPNAEGQRIQVGGLTFGAGSGYSF